MVAWKPPGHWPPSNREAYARSIEFLLGIVAGSSHMDLRQNEQSLPCITVQGTSRRWYEINTRAHYIEDYIEVDGEYREVKEVHWKINVCGAAWKSDIVQHNPHAVSLCINPRSESRGLPIGDQVGALALALRNDKTTAMRIPLLAQFIVSPRKMLRHTYQFTEEGVVMEEEVYPDEYDLYEIDDFDAFEETVHDWPGVCVIEPHEHEHLALEIENRQLDSWIEHQEAKANEEMEQPWHHDQSQIWQLEDNLRKGRR